MKAKIRYESIEVEVLDATSAEVADLVSRLKKDKGLKGFTPTVKTGALEDVPSKAAILDYLRKQPKARHSVRGLMVDLMGRTIPARSGRKSNPDYLKLLARLQAARDDLEAEKKAKFQEAGRDGKEVFYSLP